MRVIIETSWDVVCLSGFFSFVIYFQYSIFTTIMYTYMTKLDESVTPVTFGVTVTLHGIGHCLGAIGASYWTKRRYKTKKPLMIGHLLMLISNTLFIFADHFPRSIVTPYFMMTRFIGGIGMGNTAVLRTAITAHSKLDDRARTLSIFIGGRALGLVLGPGLQMIFLFLGDDGFEIFSGFSLHSHNAAGFISMILNLSAILALLTLYNEIERNGRFCSVRSTDDNENYPDPDKLAMFVCMLTRYAQNFTFYGIETLAPAFIIMMFNVERTEAVGSMSAVFFIAGVVALFFYTVFVFTDVAKKINIGKSNTISLLVFIIYLLSTYQWHFLQTPVAISNNRTQGGCDYENKSWCWGLTRTSQVTYYAGYVISFGACVPFINVGDATLYSKLFNPVGQALQQGLYDVSQIFARVVAPVVCTVIYSYFGPRRVWELLTVQLIVVTLLWIAFANRMIPLRPKPRPTFYLE